MAMMQKWIIVLVCLIILGCSLNDETRNLGNGWVLAKEGSEDVVLDGGDLIIPCQVTKYGINDDFIVAEQHRRIDCFVSKGSFIYPASLDSIYYWIVVHKKGLVLGPLEYQEYTRKRDSLLIPQSVILHPID
jgi:hypothetical protein